MKLCPGATGWDREDVDVTDFEALRARMDALGPRSIVNCVAFNDVDGAEERAEAAFALNAEFVGRLASYARERGAALVHFSTNFVFDGAAGEYAEDAAAAPLSVYGRSKRRGEELALEAGGTCYIVRTSVIFGPKGPSDLSKKSFIDLMLDLSLKRDELQVVNDEINSVTYAPDLAAIALYLLEHRPAPGLYHGTNEGAASWYDLACEAFRLKGRGVKVEPVPASKFPRKAQRPGRALLLNTKLPRQRTWQSALAEFLAEA